MSVRIVTVHSPLRLGWLPRLRPVVVGLSVGLWLVGILLPAISPVYAGPEWAWRVLDKSLQAEGTVAYEGLRDIIIFRQGRKVAGYQQKVYRASDNRERIVVVHPPQQRGRLVVSNGHQRWEYYPTTKQVITSTLPPLGKLHQTRLTSLHASRRHLHAEYLGEGTVAEQTAYIIRITGRDKRPLRQLWIDKDTFVQLKIQRFDSRGQIAYSAYFQTIKYQPTFSPELFTFKPRPNCQISRVPPPLHRIPLQAAQKQAGFRAILPRHVPPGYQLEQDSVAVTRHKNQFILWLPFSNGLDTFSIFQAPRCLQPPRVVGHSGHWWVQGKYCFALVGSLPEEEIQKIKASMGR